MENYPLPVKVVIVSDCTDVAFVEMRAAIATTFIETLSNIKLSPQIEPLVPCVPFSLTNASFLTRLVAETATPNTLIMVIANFISERTERIIGRTLKKNLFFEGTNTGAFGWLMDDFGMQDCYELYDPGFLPFGGKYVHAPAIGKALAGIPIDVLGTPFPLLKIRRHLPEVGEIVHIDNFGNAKLYIQEIGYSEGEKVLISFQDKHVDNIVAVIGKRMMSLPKGTWVIYPGSSLGLFELGQVRKRGLLDLPIEVGTKVIIRKCK